jgi:3-oxoacyl-[acyl-carrier protein] reductase
VSSQGDEPFSLAGRVALVTGGGSGIGRATALALALAGAEVMAADADPEGLADTAAVVAEAGGRAHLTSTDLAGRDEVHGLVRRTVARCGRLDLMVNVVGTMEHRPLLAADEDHLERLLAADLRAVFFGCQAALAHMAAQGSGGSVVNVASPVVDEAAEGLAASAMAQAAILTLTRVAAREAGAHGVRVNAVAPGLVLTPAIERFFRIEAHGAVERRREAVLRSMKTRSPLGLVGEPEDVAYAVLYLASDAARFVTGQVLRPNGGAVMA